MRPVSLPLLKLLVLCSVAAHAADTPAPDRSTGGAPEPAALTLEEAIRLALAKSFTIETAHFGPLIARARQLEAAGAFDPALNANYNVSDGVGTVSANPLDGTPPGFYSVKYDSLQASVGGQTPFGLTYALVGNANNQRGSYNNYAGSFYTFGGLRITQPLLRGFGFAPNLAGIRVARANRAVADARFRQVVIDTLTETIELYNNLYFAQRAYENAVQSRQRADALLRENRRRLEVGSMATADVTIAEARVARLGDGVLQYERGLRNAQNLLRTYISADLRPAVDTPLLIVPPVALPPPALDRDADLARALVLRSDFRQAAEDVRLAEAGLGEARSRALPQVDFVGSFGRNGAGTTFSRAYRDARNGDTTSWTAGAVVNVPLLQRDGRGRLRAARFTLAQAQNELRRTEQAIVVDLANAAGHIDSNRRRVEATQHARELAQQSLAAEEKRLQVGQSSTFTVLQFQELLSAAELAELRARADYNIALARYDRASGTTLEKHGVSLDGTIRN